MLLQRAMEERYQDRFSFLWFAIALGVTSIMTTAVIVGLPMVVQKLDFEGSAGMTMAIPVWFASGLLVGLISPGRTFAEPTCAAVLVAVPTVLFLVQSETVKTMPVYLYVLFSALGVFFSLVGSYAGERIQMGPRPRSAE